MGGWELLLIAGLALLLFGPDKLPEFARTLGRLIRDFKKYQDLMESTIRAEMYAKEPAEKPDPFKTGKEFREKVAKGDFDRKRDEEAEPAEAVDSEETAETADGEGEGIAESAAADGDEAAGAATTDDASPDSEAVEAAEEPRPHAELPPDHPLYEKYAAGEDVGLDEDLDLADLDPSDLGWVPGKGTLGKEGKDEA
ncbi:MAG: twin-arginine translocase TatA/TatE family subunit [Coriobacteriia bacterium]|nr:twin-arginine translocase TatA/TatE family subunit [Coriobacteriia bacterium]